MEDFYPFVLFALILFVFWAVRIYNKFIKYRNMIEEGWSIIDVFLKRRANLIPKLIAAVRGYQNHEAEVLEKITQQRVESQSGSEREQVGKSESQVSRSLSGLIAVAESNPDLRASSNFLELQEALNQLELEIAQARNEFNRRIRTMNTLVQQFPSNIIAQIFGFAREEYFSLELVTERELPSTPWDQ